MGDILGFTGHTHDYCGLCRANPGKHKGLWHIALGLAGIAGQLLGKAVDFNRFLVQINGK